MFHFAQPVPAPRVHLSPRDKYLNALQQAKEAEAEYFAAEALEREEAALRTRLAEIQRQKRQPSIDSFLLLRQRAQEEQEQKKYVLDAFRQQEALARQEERRRHTLQQQQLAALVQQHQKELEQRSQREAIVRHEQERRRRLQQEQLAALVREQQRQKEIQRTQPQSHSDALDILSALFGSDSAPQPESVGAPLQPRPRTRSTQPIHVTFEAPSAQPSQSAQPVRKPAVQPTLKQQLEARLQADTSEDIQETIRSLLDAMHATPSPSTSPSPAVPSVQTDKGKAAATRSATPVKEPKTVDEAFAAIQEIEAAFNNLSSEFVFPSQLDFTPPSSAPTSPVHSDAESSITRRLTFTSRNSPVKFYEQALTSLLLKLDNIESFGNDELRRRRKDVVNKVEKTIEDLEDEVDGRWRAKSGAERKEFASTAMAAPESDSVPPVEETPAVSQTAPVPAALPEATSDMDSEPSLVVSTPQSQDVPEAPSAEEVPVTEAIEHHGSCSTEQALNTGSHIAIALLAAPIEEPLAALSEAEATPLDMPLAIETEAVEQTLPTPTASEAAEESLEDDIVLIPEQPEAVTTAQETEEESVSSPSEYDDPSTSSYPPSLSASLMALDPESLSSSVHVELLAQSAPALLPPSLSTSTATIKATAASQVDAENSFLESAFPPSPQMKRPAHSEEDSDWSDVGAD